MGEMGQVRLLGVVQVLQQRPRRGHSRGEILDTQPDQGIHLKMAQQEPPASVVVKQMGLQRVDGDVVLPPQPLHIEAADQEILVADDFRGLVLHQLVVQLL